MKANNREIKFRYWDINNQEMANGWLCDLYTNEDINEDGKLMQYTGLKDKNGNEIYEGDICDFGNQITSIQWTNCGFNGVYHNSDGSWDDQWEDQLSSGDARKCIVIGNVYENPELVLTNN